MISKNTLYNLLLAFDFFCSADIMHFLDLVEPNSNLESSGSDRYELQNKTKSALLKAKAKINAAKTGKSKPSAKSKPSSKPKRSGKTEYYIDR